MSLEIHILVSQITQRYSKAGRLFNDLLVFSSPVSTYLKPFSACRKEIIKVQYVTFKGTLINIPLIALLKKKNYLFERQKERASK